MQGGVFPQVRREAWRFIAIITIDLHCISDNCCILFTGEPPNHNHLRRNTARTGSMKILLVYPHYPDTFWSFRHALKFIGKKAAFPPLGLLTVAAMLPAEWDIRLVDMNVQPLSDQQIQWADYVFISAMAVQKESVNEVLARCRRLGARTVVGGPLFTAAPAEFDSADHLVLGEAEVTLPRFLHDLDRGKPEHSYVSDRWAEVRETPIPLWKLINPAKYAAMNIQYSRGCPFDCEFCDITQLFGRKPRTKTTRQLTAELDALYAWGWRDGIFFVDDNFIGDKRKLKNETLPAVLAWMEQHKHPFAFFTEVSIDLADDPELMELMVRTGFEEVFIGIESPNEECLNETGKVQNKNRNLLESVKKIQHAGLQVQGGFIVGFDSDPCRSSSGRSILSRKAALPRPWSGYLSHCGAQSFTSGSSGKEVAGRRLRQQHGRYPQLYPPHESGDAYQRLSEHPYQHLFPEELLPTGNRLSSRVPASQARQLSREVRLLRGILQIHRHAGGDRQGADPVLEALFLVPNQAATPVPTRHHLCHLWLSLSENNGEDRLERHVRLERHRTHLITDR